MSDLITWRDTFIHFIDTESIKCTLNNHEKRFGVLNPWTLLCNDEWTFPAPSWLPRGGRVRSLWAGCHACWVNNRARLAMESWQDASGPRRRVINSRRWWMACGQSLVLAASHWKPEKSILSMSGLRTVKGFSVSHRFCVNVFYTQFEFTTKFMQKLWYLEDFRPKLVGYTDFLPKLIIMQSMESTDIISVFFLFTVMFIFFLTPTGRFCCNLLGLYSVIPFMSCHSNLGFQF